jgi:hypothetical protein
VSVRVFDFSDAVVRELYSNHNFLFVHVFDRNFVIYYRLVNSKDEKLVFYYAEHKDTWVFPRDPAGGLCSGSRGPCPIITLGLVALFYLFYFSNCLS